MVLPENLKVFGQTKHLYYRYRFIDIDLSFIILPLPNKSFFPPKPIIYPFLINHFKHFKLIISSLVHQSFFPFLILSKSNGNIVGKNRMN